MTARMLKWRGGEGDGVGDDDAGAGISSFAVALATTPGTGGWEGDLHTGAGGGEGLRSMSC